MPWWKFNRPKTPGVWEENPFIQIRFEPVLPSQLLSWCATQGWVRDIDFRYWADNEIHFFDPKKAVMFKLAMGGFDKWLDVYPPPK